jgi:hypothetical protein
MIGLEAREMIYFQSKNQGPTACTRQKRTIVENDPKQNPGPITKMPLKHHPRERELKGAANTTKASGKPDYDLKAPSEGSRHEFERIG